MLQSKYTGFTWKLNFSGCFSAFTTVVSNICYVLNVSFTKTILLSLVMMQMLKYDNFSKGIKVGFVVADATIQ